MKFVVSKSLALPFILLAANTASAQMMGLSVKMADDARAERHGYPEFSSFASNKHLSGTFQIPEIRKSLAEISEPLPVFMTQDAYTLSTEEWSKRDIEKVVDLSVLREVSAYRQANRIKIKVSDVQVNGIQSGLAELTAAYRKPGQSSKSADCSDVTISVEQRIKLDPSAVLEIVESEISANPKCACEIVKIAIRASEADVELVVDITEVAITSAPESMRIISQCAIAARPEALPAIQALFAKLDPNSGDYGSSKSGKDSKDAVASEFSSPESRLNPLDPPNPPGGGGSVTPPGGGGGGGDPPGGGPLPPGTPGPPTLPPPPISPVPPPGTGGGGGGGGGPTPTPTPTPPPPPPPPPPPVTDVNP